MIRTSTCAALMGALLNAILLTGSASDAHGGACAGMPSGLVATWKAENDARDAAGALHGMLTGNTTYGPGKLGTAFVLDGVADGVSIPDHPSLRLSDFTIMAWVKRQSPERVTLDGTTSVFFSYFWGGYGLGIENEGRLFLTKVGYSAVYSTRTLKDSTRFHHVAVTKHGSKVIFYLDGVAEEVSAYDPNFEYLGSAAIGSRGGDFVSSFEGSIDEIHVFNRALDGTELRGIYTAEDSGTPPCECLPHTARLAASVVNGFVIRVDVIDPGCGYKEPPRIEFNGPGSGAQATAVLTNGTIREVVIENAGRGYTSAPSVIVAAPPRGAYVTVAVSKVKVTQRLAVGGTYTLESSPDLVLWTPVAPPFVAEAPEVVQEFDVQVTGAYYRLREGP